MLYFELDRLKSIHANIIKMPSLFWLKKQEQVFISVVYYGLREVVELVMNILWRKKKQYCISKIMLE